MTEEDGRCRTRTWRIIKAPRRNLYDASLNPHAPIEWLPPADMTGEIHEFDARVGGGYRMSLFYPAGERAFRGKTSDKEDMVKVRFVALVPPIRIVEEAHKSHWRSGTCLWLAGTRQRDRRAIVPGAVGRPLRTVEREL